MLLLHKTHPCTLALVHLRLQRSFDCEKVCGCRCPRHLHCLPRHLLRVTAATMTSQAHLLKMQQKVNTQTRKVILSKTPHLEEALASAMLLKLAEKEIIRYLPYKYGMQITVFAEISVMNPNLDIILSKNVVLLVSACIVPNCQQHRLALQGA